MKTPEQMAIRYSDLREFADRRLDYKAKMLLEQGFLAGYQAAKDQLADADKVMCNTTLEEIKAVDTGEIIPITNLPTSAKWISVKERLPEEGQIVLTSCEQGKMFLLRKVSEEFLGGTLLWQYCCGYDKDLVDGESYCYEITHWMPLPNAPKGEG